MSARKVALVTGSGARRVGSHVAEALAARGYALAIHYRSSRAEAEAFVARLGVPALAVQADLADEAAVKRMTAAVLERFGRIDALANCAAIWNRKRLEDVTAADVREHFEANTLGTFLTCQHVGLQMVKQPDGGSIVNVGDWADVRPYLDYAAYFPSKAAIPGLTRVFAVDARDRRTGGVRPAQRRFRTGGGDAVSEPRVVGVQPWFPWPLSRWSWWTDPIPAERVAALRIATALVLLVDLFACWLPHFSTLFSIDALGGRDLYAERFGSGHYYWSLLRVLPDSWGAQAVLAGWALAAVGLLVGWRPLPCGLACWAYAVSVWELRFPVLAVMRGTRAAALVIGVIFHLGTLLTLEVGMFALYAVACYAAFAPWERLRTHPPAPSLQGGGERA